MNELGKMLCRDLDVIKECRIRLLVLDRGGWRLELADEKVSSMVILGIKHQRFIFYTSALLLMRD